MVLENRLISLEETLTNISDSLRADHPAKSILHQNLNPTIEIDRKPLLSRKRTMGRSNSRNNVSCAPIPGLDSTAYQKLLSIKSHKLSPQISHKAIKTESKTCENAIRMSPLAVYKHDPNQHKAYPKKLLIWTPRRTANFSGGYQIIKNG